METFVEVMAFLYATGIMGLLARMCVDVHDIKKVFNAMKDAINKIENRLLDHDARISNLEKTKEQEA